MNTEFCDAVAQRDGHERVGPLILSIATMLRRTAHVIAWQSHSAVAPSPELRINNEFV